jgi:hypothetical protein
VPDAMSEAIAALRVLGDPAKAFHTKDHMRQFARAARERVVQMHHGPPQPPPPAKLDVARETPHEDRADRQLSVVYAKRETAENALEHWQRRGIAAVVEEVESSGGRSGFAVMEAA